MRPANSGATVCVVVECAVLYGDFESERYGCSFLSASANKPHPFEYAFQTRLCFLASEEEKPL